jgi:hypothetical protein
VFVEIIVAFIEYTEVVCMKSQENEKTLGPVLTETQAVEYEFPMEKLPLSFHKIRIYILEDRDTHKKNEIIVKWGDVIVYRCMTVTKYRWICDKVRNGEFFLEMRNNRLILELID